MGCDDKSGGLSILALRFPQALKQQLLHGRADFSDRLSCHPIFFHIHVLRYVALNHVDSCVSLSQELNKQVVFPHTACTPTHIAASQTRPAHSKNRICCPKVQLRSIRDDPRIS